MSNAQISFLDEIIVDSFAGGGGASTGIELAAELARHLNGQAKVENIREEMADAFIMLNQMEMIFGDVSDVEIRKLERLEGMVAEG